MQVASAGRDFCLEDQGAGAWGAGAPQLLPPIRVLTWMRVVALAVLMWMGAGACFAQGPGTVAEQYLFAAANAERQQRGLAPLQWDGALHHAAVQHAREMAARESISHQYPGEADLAARAQTAGAHFSVVAENVAEAPSAVIVHDAWMHSPDHRRNLLDERVDRVGIAVLLRRGQLYAVQDFDRGVPSMSFEHQERAVASLLGASSNLYVDVADEAARRTCAMSSGFAGNRRPWFIMRFSAGELNALPEALKNRLATGRYRQAAVGACSTHAAEPFTSYNIAVLLFP